MLLLDIAAGEGGQSGVRLLAHIKKAPDLGLVSKNKVAQCTRGPELPLHPKTEAVHMHNGPT